MTENEWTKASSQFMPPQRKARMHRIVTPVYTAHNPLAVWAIRGVSCESFIGPGASALNICRPPMPSSGSTATASTIRPMPPSQTSRPRQRLIEAGSRSRFGKTVDPVVVRPETASK